MFLRSGVFHRGLTTSQRLENALAGFVILDLGSMLAAETAKETGQSKDRCWLHHATHNNLQQLSGCLAIACSAYPDSLPFKPWYSTELVLEEWFGSLRHQFKSSQMTVRDYLHASARQMKSHLQRCSDLQEGRILKSSSKMADPLPESTMFKAVSEKEFQECADRALEGALSLMSCCCKYSPEELLKHYASFSAARKFQNVTMENNIDDSEDPEVDFEDDQDAPPGFVHKSSDVERSSKDVESEPMSSSDKQCLLLLQQLQARESFDASGLEVPSSSTSANREEMQRLGAGSMPPPVSLDEVCWKEMIDADTLTFASKPGSNGTDRAALPEKQASPSTSTSWKASNVKTLTSVFQSMCSASPLRHLDPVIGLLWLLLTNLRCPADSRFLKNPQGCRIVTKKLNWQQLHERECMLIRQQTGVSGKRTGFFLIEMSLGSLGTR